MYRWDVSRFLGLRSRTRFRRNGGRRVPFFCFMLPDSFSTVSRASSSVFMFCAPGLFFGIIEGIGSYFHVLRFRTHFRRYRGRQFPLSCFAPPDSFSVVPRASGLVFKFCSPALVFDGTDDVDFHFHVLRALTRFRRYRRRRGPFSCFALPDMFSAVPSASGPVFMFCASGLVFGGSKGVGSCFHVLCTRTCFRWYRGRRLQFSCFALPDSFSAVPCALGPVFIFCTPGLIFSGTEGVGSHFHVLHDRTRFRRY
jgi:hypothetical protein